MPGANFRVDGVRDLRRKLDKLEPKVRQRAEKAVIRAAGRVVVKAARERAPQDTGALKASLGQRVKVYKPTATIVTVIGARSKFKSKKLGITDGRLGKRRPSKYAHLVEYGTAPHRIPKKPGRLVAFGGRVFGGVMHPGSRPRPFMRPAFAVAKVAAFAVMKRQLADTIQKEARR